MKKIFYISLFLTFLFLILLLINNNNHVHTYNDYYDFDSEYHYHKSNCVHDLKQDIEAHIYEGIKCKICGYSKPKNLYTKEEIYDVYKDIIFYDELNLDFSIINNEEIETNYVETNLSNEIIKEEHLNNKYIEKYSYNKGENNLLYSNNSIIDNESQNILSFYCQNDQKIYVKQNEIYNSYLIDNGYISSYYNNLYSEIDKLLYNKSENYLSLNKYINDSYNRSYNELIDKLEYDLYYDNDLFVFDIKINVIIDEDFSKHNILIKFNNDKLISIKYINESLDYIEGFDGIINDYKKLTNVYDFFDSFDTNTFIVDMDNYKSEEKKLKSKIYFKGDIDYQTNLAEMDENLDLEAFLNDNYISSYDDILVYSDKNYSSIVELRDIKFNSFDKTYFVKFKPNNTYSIIRYNEYFSMNDGERIVFEEYHKVFFKGEGEYIIPKNANEYYEEVNSYLDEIMIVSDFIITYNGKNVEKLLIENNSSYDIMVNYKIDLFNS